MFFNQEDTEPYGPELVTNGTFDTDLSGWTVTNPNCYWVSDNGGSCRCENVAGSVGSMRQRIAYEVGKTYRMSWDVVNSPFGAAADFQVYENSKFKGTAESVGSYERIFVYTTAPNLAIIRTVGVDTYIDIKNFSVKEVL